MKRRLRNVIRVGAVLGAVAGSAIGLTGGAQAYTYDGQNPSTTGCSSGATTIASARIYTNATHIDLGSIELRYSFSCHTAWARLTGGIGDCGDYAAGYACPVGWINRNNDGRGYSCLIKSGEHQCYTAMVYDKGLTSYASGLYDTAAGSGYARTVSY